MTICIARKVFNEIRAHAEATYPEECCGLLIAEGGVDAVAAPNSRKTISESIRMNNAYEGPKRDRYNIDPLELFRADRAISQRKGFSIAGIYHSHPDYPASLSKFDLEHSFPWYSYVVISVPKGRSGDTKSWIPREDHKTVFQEDIEVVGQEQ
jgi:proteasome lid subunit RPN8/RPN11